jgi:hypothetical protein
LWLGALSEIPEQDKHRHGQSHGRTADGKQDPVRHGLPP